MASEYVKQRLAEIASAQKEKPRPQGMRYLVVERSRHGKRMYYYRKGSGPRVRLPDPAVYGESALNIAYAQADRGIKPEYPAPYPTPTTARGTGRKGFVYFAESGGNVKIGFSKSVNGRVSTLKTGCAEPLRVLLAIPGTDETEAFFHAHFAAHRMQGEWFRFDGKLADFLDMTRSAPSP